MSSEEDDKDGRSLAEQLEQLDVDAPDRAEVAADDEESSESDGDDEDAADPDRPSPQEQFEDALDDLSAEDLQEKRFDRGASGPEEEQSNSEGGGGSVASADAEPAHPAIADSLGDVDREQFPEGGATSQAKDRNSETGRSEDRTERDDPATLEEALDGLSPSEMRERKFGDPSESEHDQGGVARRSDAEDTEDRTGGGPGPTDSDRKGGGPELDDEQKRQFERAMRDVDRSGGSSKYRPGNAPDPEEYFEEEASRTAEDFVTPRVPKSGEALNDIPKLDEAQRAMLERCERWEKSEDVPEVHLRGERVRDALDRLSRRVARALREGARFIRVVHGRGQRSDGAPRLKPAVLKWLERSAADRIRGYVPERQFGGDYGSTVVEFRSSR